MGFQPTSAAPLHWALRKGKGTSTPRHPAQTPQHCTANASSLPSYLYAESPLLL